MVEQPRLPAIARVWRGYGTRQGVDRYCREHFNGTVLPSLRALEGFLGARVLVRDLADTDEVEVLVQTLWSSLDAVRAFAGADYTRAVVEPVVHELLTRFDAHVVHYIVALDV